MFRWYSPLGAICLLVVTGWCSPPSAQAQDQFEVDLTGGLYNANIANSGEKVGSAITNPYGGLTVTSPALFLTDTSRAIQNLALSLEPHYQVAGADFDNPQYQHKFHYFSLPLQARAELFSSFEVLIGAAPAFLVTDFRENTTTDPDNLPLSEPDRLHSWGSVGIEAPLSEHFNLRLAYKRSLGPIAPESDFTFTSFQLGLSYEISQAVQRQPEDLRPDERQMKAWRHIKQLRRGILLVRLSAKRKQLQYLKKEKQKLRQQLDTLANPSARKKYQALDDKIQNLKDQTRNRHQRTVKAFRKHFDFCEVAFFYDYQTDTILSQQWPEAVFQKPGKAGQYTPAADQPRYILDVGSSFLKTEGRTYEGMVVRGTTLQVLKEPFPAKHPNTQTFSFMNLNSNRPTMVRELNEALQEYYLERRDQKPLGR